MNKSELVAGAAPVLKNKGYKKRNTTWVKKSDDEIFVVVNIQGSQYDKNDFYVNLGVYIRPLGTKELPCISDCQMRERIVSPVDSAKILGAVADKWEGWYGTYDKIREKVIEQKMPTLTNKNVYAYFLVEGR